MKCIVVGGTNIDVHKKGKIFYLPLGTEVDLIKYEESISHPRDEYEMNCLVGYNGARYWYPEESLLFLNNNVVVNTKGEKIYEGGYGQIN